MYVVVAILPIEMGIHSLRTILESEIPEVDWLQSRYDQLCMMGEKRLKALYITSKVTKGDSEKVLTRK